MLSILWLTWPFFLLCSMRETQCRSFKEVLYTIWHNIIFFPNWRSSHNLLRVLSCVSSQIMDSSPVLSTLNDGSNLESFSGWSRRPEIKLRAFYKHNRVSTEVQIFSFSWKCCWRLCGAKPLNLLRMPLEAGMGRNAFIYPESGAHFMFNTAAIQFIN